MCGVCSMHGRQEENLKERDHLEDIDVCGRIILECILGKWGGKLCGMN
jgi:hypothetical protein